MSESELPSAVLVRRAEPSDLDAVVRIEQASFADPWTPDSFHSTLGLERMRFLVAEDASGGDGVLGYVIALVASDEGEIADLAVDAAVRGRGIGGVLLDRVMADAVVQGVRALYLEVRESNDAARRLYRSRSFEEVGRRRGYYRHPPEDALLMRRDLDVT